MRPAKAAVRDPILSLVLCCVVVRQFNVIAWSVTMSCVVAGRDRSIMSSFFGESEGGAAARLIIVDVGGGGKSAHEVKGHIKHSMLSSIQMTCVCETRAVCLPVFLQCTQRRRIGRL